MNKTLIKFAVASALAISATSALADEDMFRGAWYALPGINYNFTDSDVKADDDVGGFIRFGKEVTQNWDIQVGGSYTNPDRNTSLSTGGNYKQTLFGVDALYFFSRDKLRPFLLAGVGAARNENNYSNATWGGSKTSAMGEVGAGVQYLFNDTVGIQADVREVWSRAEVGFAGSQSDKTINNTVLGLGVIFRFGAPKPVAAMPVAEPEVVAAMDSIVPYDEEALPALEEKEEALPACTPSTETLTVQSDTLFGFDKALISENGKQELNAVAEKLKAHPEIELVLVTGHTDRIGSAAYNQKLSERRAKAVKEYLIAQGVHADKMQSAGKGKTEPVQDCKGVKGKKQLIECLAPNRRVVIEATYKQETGCSQ